MDVGRVGSLFIRGLEEFSGRNESYFTLTFQNPFDGPRLLGSLESLVRASPTLRLRLAATESGDLDWRPFSAEEVDERLAAERLVFEAGARLEAAFSDHAPGAGALPLRLRRVDDRRVVLIVNHAFANGLATLHWIERWLELYDRGEKTSSPAQAQTHRSVRTGAAGGLAAVGGYLGAFVLNAGPRPAETTVDLSRGRRPTPQDPGCAVQTYSLPEEQTTRLRSAGRQRNLSVSGALCAALASALFEAQPEKSRVCLSVPTDLHERSPAVSLETAGNYTGSVILQTRRGRPLDEQVRAGLAWARRGVDYWLPRTLGALTPERRLLERFRRQAELAIPDRAPFENFSAAVSSLGVVRGPQAGRYLAAISAHTRMQTIFLCAMTLHDRMSIEVSVPTDLFEPREAFGVVERALAGLTGDRVEAIGRAAGARA